MQPAPTCPPLPLVPLVVGVTGHRDLRPQDRAPLLLAASAVLAFVEVIRSLLRGERPALALVLIGLATLAALAVGAWHLVAAWHWSRRNRSLAGPEAKTSRRARTAGIGWGLLLLAAFAAVLLLARDWLPRLIPWMEGREASWMIVAITLTLALAGLPLVYAQTLALDAEARQYASMRVLFTQASAALAGGGHPKHLDAAPRADPLRRRAREILGELGEQALAESGEWVLLHRRRPVEPPIA